LGLLKKLVSQVPVTR